MIWFGSRPSLYEIYDRSLGRRDKRRGIVSSNPATHCSSSTSSGQRHSFRILRSRWLPHPTQPSILLACFRPRLLKFGNNSNSSLVPEGTHMDLSQALPSLASLLVVVPGPMNLLRSNAATTCWPYILDLLAVFPPSEDDSAACSEKTDVVMTNYRSMGSAHICLPTIFAIVSGPAESVINPVFVSKIPSKDRTSFQHMVHALSVNIVQQSLGMYGLLRLLAAAYLHMARCGPEYAFRSRCPLLFSS